MAEITRDVLLEQKAQLEARHRKLVADLNATSGALELANALLAHLEAAKAVDDAVGDRAAEKK